MARIEMAQNYSVNQPTLGQQFVPLLPGRRGGEGRRVRVNCRIPGGRKKREENQRGCTMEVDLALERLTISSTSPIL
jgi:hypothetical protein